MLLIKWLRAEVSHPSRVRELKPWDYTIDSSTGKSHPSRVRELKLYDAGFAVS